MIESASGRRLAGADLLWAVERSRKTFLTVAMDVGVAVFETAQKLTIAALLRMLRPKWAQWLGKSVYQWQTKESASRHAH
jgi:TRAP-type C4-dicarboxylate transport system permease small subunit